MIHTIAAVENICTTVMNLEKAKASIIGKDEEAEKAKEGIMDARDYILSAVNADTRFNDMCNLYKEMLDRNLTYIDISDGDLYLSSHKIINIFREFGVARFTMSMSNTETMKYADDFCNNGYYVAGMCNLNDSKPAITFMMK